MSDAKDQNDLAREGKLPPNPSDGTVRMTPGKVADLDSKRGGAEFAIAHERALLGSLLWAGQWQPGTLRARSVTDLLESGEPFAGRSHGDVYDAILACERAGVEPEPVTVGAQMAMLGRPARTDLLADLSDKATTISEPKARAYAQAVRDAWARRKAIAEARGIIDLASNPATDSATLMAQTQALGTQLAQRISTTSAVVQVNDSAAAFIRRMMDAKNTAMPTGLRDLDAVLNGGLRPKEVSIIAARTNVGKSILCSQIAKHMVSANDDVGALYVSLEMAHEMFTARMLSAQSGVPLSNLRRAVLNSTQWQSLSAAATHLAAHALYFADSPTQTLASIYASGADAARRLAKSGRALGLIVVDHLGLVKPSAELIKKSNREQQVAETSRGLRFIASELGCHVIGIAQIGRSAVAQKGPDTMPQLHHLRESGSLEQDADLVLILHRPRDPRTTMFLDNKPAALAVAKGRMDETAVMLLGYHGATASFSDWNGTETFADVYGGA